MALDSVPPWLQITPNYFTSALEAGARAGLGVAELNRRADEFAAAQAERNARAQERAAEEAERSRQFEATRLLNVQKIAQDAAQLQQQQRHQAALEAHQAAQESRLLSDFNLERNIADKAGFVEGRAGMFPSHILDARGAPHFPPQPTVASMAPQERTPIPVKDAAGTVIGFDVGGGRILSPPKPVAEGKLSDIDKALLAAVAREESSLLAGIRLNPSKSEALQQDLLAVQRRRNTILRNAGASTPVTAPAPTVLAPSTNAVHTVGVSGATGIIHPLPNNKSDLVVGDIYDVNGVARRWDGKNLIRVENAR